MQTVRRARPDDVSACLAIVRALPDYFTADVPAEVERDLHAQLGWVATTEAGQVLGFVVVDRRSRRAAEIRWLAVAPAARRTGVATRLLDQALGERRRAQPDAALTRGRHANESPRRSIVPRPGNGRW